jgi:putative ABC transport system permease protein
MIRSYLKIAWRNFYKHQFYSLINVFGLALGISCTIVLFLFISYHLSFDTYHANAKRIYRAVTDLHLPDGSIEYDQGSPLILGQMLKQEVPAVKNQTVLLDKRTFTVAVPQPGETKQNLFNETETVAFTDNNWFKLFTYNWISGNQNAPLTEPYTAVITADLARKYFNTTDALGKTIRLDNKYNVTITGVLQDNPKNTDVQSKMFLSLASVKSMYPEDAGPLYHDWGFISSKNHVFVLLTDEQAQQQVGRNIKAITKKALDKEADVYQFHLQPLNDIHFNNRYSGTVAKPLLLILATIGLALILIACVNFINMATAQSLTRAKEIGTRKVLGGSQQGIFWQFITETAYVTLVAVIIAVLMTLLFLPQLNSWLQLPLAINKNLILFLVILIVLVVFIAGFYPAVILSRFKPVNALKNIISNINPTSKLSRGVLIVAQNVIAQVLIVCTLIITLQVKFLKNKDMGFNKTSVIMVPVPEKNLTKLSFFHDQLSSYPGVKSVTFCYQAPAAERVKGGSIRYDGHEWEKFTVFSVIGDENYLKTFGIQLLAGRNLTSQDTTNTYLVNQQVLAKLGIKNPEQAIGHKITAGDFGDQAGTIIGVVKNFHSHPLYSALDPALITKQSAYFQYAAVKIDGSNQQETINTIQQKWQSAFPQNVFEYHFLDEQLADFYHKDEMINKLIRTSSIIAIAISCLGMLGLISLITVQRTKEIGIRKVLGASVGNIVSLLTGSFLKLIMIAIIIGTPIAWWAMHNWLQSFAYRIEITWWVFGLAAAVALGIACLTVSIQAIRAAVSNPVKSLRNN